MMKMRKSIKKSKIIESIRLTCYVYDSGHETKKTSQKENKKTI